MLKTLQDLFDRLLPPAPEAGAAEPDLRLATAVLLVEVMRADARFDDEERAAVLQALQEGFALADDDAARLADLAERTAREATDLFTFTSHINAHYDMARKLAIVEQMWRVAYADGRLSEHERHLLWRVADLLHVPQGAYVNARLRAREAAGLAGGCEAAGLAG